MSSPYASHSSSLANLANAASSAAVPNRAVPAGTLPPGTLVTVGKHNVTIERWLSEGTAPPYSTSLLREPGLIGGKVDLRMCMSCD